MKNRETSENFSCSRLDSQRHFLDTNVSPVRRRTRPGTSSVLDRLASSMAMATLPNSCGRLATCLAGLTYFRMLHRHRVDHLGPVGRSDGIDAVHQSQQ